MIQTKQVNQEKHLGEKLANKAYAMESGTQGHFVQSKQAAFDQAEDKISPRLVNPDIQKEPKMVDYTAIRRGLNFHGMNANQAEKERDTIKKEEEMIEREEAAAKKADKSYGDDDKAAQKKAEKEMLEAAKKAMQEEEEQGKLKMAEVT